MTSTLIRSTPLQRALLVLALAAAAALPRLAHAAAATPETPALPSDMKLWSFGDCDRQFPYADAEEHVQCVRVVGSEEARDARAFGVCEKSYGKDRDEAERCKENYRANRQRAAQHGLVPHSTAASTDAPTPEMMQKVRLLAAAAVESDRATSAQGAPATAEAALAAAPQAGPTAPEPEDSFSPISMLRAMAPILVLAGGFFLFKRQREKGRAHG